MLSEFSEHDKFSSKYSYAGWLRSQDWLLPDSRTANCLSPQAPKPSWAKVVFVAVRVCWRIKPQKHCIALFARLELTEKLYPKVSLFGTTKLPAHQIRLTEFHLTRQFLSWPGSSVWCEDKKSKSGLSKLFWIPRQARDDSEKWLSWRIFLFTLHTRQRYM